MKKWMAVIFFVIFAASPAFADGDCPEREMNASEAAEYNQLQSALRTALPRPPADYKFSGLDKKPIVCKAHAADEMLRMQFEAQYKPDKDVALGRAQTAMMDKMKGTPEQQKRMAALDAREEELTRARKNTRSSGEKDRIREELKKVRAEARALRNEIDEKFNAEMGSGGYTNTLKSIDSASPELTVQIKVNQLMYVRDDSKPYPVQGATLAFEEGNQKEYRITILLGRFEKERKSYYKLLNTSRGTSTKARGMGFIFSGPGDKAQNVKDLVRKTDLTKLKNLVR